jgi:hypothetical protein
MLEEMGGGPGRAVQVDSIKPSFLELNATRLINLDRANNVSSRGRAVQVDSIKSRVESAFGVMKLKYDKPLSSFAFKFNVRRYTPAALGSRPA